MRISQEKISEIKEILGGQEFLIIIAIPEGLIERRGQKGAGLTGVDMVTSLNADATEYLLLSAATAIVEGNTLWGGTTEN
jgi:hypothetical protein